ncbi:MAG: hypothetical protein ACRC6V_10470 [Bacteroidales bacterium]
MSEVMTVVEEAYPELSQELRRYCVWAAGIVKQFFQDSKLWDVMEIMEKWAADPASVSNQELNNAHLLAKDISRKLCSGHYWITDKSYVSAYVVACLTDFKHCGRGAMNYIEQAYKLHIEFSTEVIVARNNLESARKVAQLDYNPKRTQYQMLGGHQLVIGRENARKIQDSYEKLFESKIHEARGPQWVMFNQMILSRLY